MQQFNDEYYTYVSLYSSYYESYNSFGAIIFMEFSGEINERWFVVRETVS